MIEPIHIYSDVVCPWCLVGKTRLDKALALLSAEGRESPEIFWHPYELNPDAPPDGEDRVERLSAKYGASQVKILDERLNAIGKTEGIPWDIQRIERIPNTFKAHRLIAFAQRQGKGHAMAGALFQAYFVDGVDIARTEVLLDIGVKQGLKEDELTIFFAGQEGVEQLRAEENEAINAGLRGVPYYLINGKPMVGAQDIETFIKALKDT